MTAHTSAETAQPGTTPIQPPNLMRLRMRETALRQQAAHLQARAEHLERVGRTQAKQLQRRIDAHEKIVLGALVKKAGLAIPLPDGNAGAQRQPNDNESMPIRRGIDAQSTAYDRAFILGALMWLGDALRQPAITAIDVPERQQLRARGHQALKDDHQQRNQTLRS